ncbi:hypothetical protein FRC03_002983 [Tulasnella sp. 419]|nr:hypothetical protein FRC03_002983 [Tulasnella sp. 419]
MGDMPLQGAHLIGTLVGQLAYGIYLYLTGLVLIRIKRGCGPIGVVGIFLILLWIVTTTAQGIRVLTTYVAFVSRDASSGPRWFYGQEYRGSYRPAYKFVIYLDGILSDSLLCWRMYVLWNKNRMILVVPVALLASVIGSFSGAFAYALKSTSSDGGKEHSWELAGVLSALAINVLVTILICWRIRHVADTFSGHTVGNMRLYRHLIHVMAEGGALYAALIFSYLIVAAAKLEAPSIILVYLGPAVAGITPTLIILRLSSTYGTSEFDWGSRATPSSVSDQTVNIRAGEHAGNIPAARMDNFDPVSQAAGKPGIP